MAIQYFQPEIWSAQLLSVLSKSLVYAGAPCVNRDYEGTIANAGDTVHIVSVADPNIVDYTKDSDLTVQVLTDSEQQLLIDQAKAFAFEVDDIDRRQVASGGALMSEAAQRAAFGLADKADQFVVGKMVVGASNAIGVVDATTATNVYDKLIVPAKVKLDQANVPTAGRWLVVDPAAHGQLLLDSRFIKHNESGTESLQNGVVGTAGGFTIMLSNNAPVSARSITGTVTVATTAATLTAAAGTFNKGDVGLTVAGTRITGGSKIASVNSDGSIATMDTAGATAGTQTDTVLSGGGQVAVAGSSIATSYAEQISKVEAFRPEKRFADALKGLHLYGAKVTRPSGLVVASVKVA